MSWQSLIIIIRFKCFGAVVFTSYTRRLYCLFYCCNVNTSVESCSFFPFASTCLIFFPTVKNFIHFPRMPFNSPHKTGVTSFLWICSVLALSSVTSALELGCFSPVKRTCTSYCVLAAPGETSTHKSLSENENSGKYVLMPKEKKKLFHLMKDLY